MDDQLEKEEEVDNSAQQAGVATSQQQDGHGFQGTKGWKPWLDNLTFFSILYVITIALLTGLTSWRNFMGFGAEVKVTMSLRSMDFQTMAYIIVAYVIILLLIKMNIIPHIIATIAGVLGVLVSLGYLLYGLIIIYQIYKEERLLEQSTVIGIVLTIGFGLIGLRSAIKSFKLRPSKD